jgi:hypothetical protein
MPDPMCVSPTIERILTTLDPQQRFTKSRETTRFLGKTEMRVDTAEEVEVAGSLGVTTKTTTRGFLSLLTIVTGSNNRGDKTLT